MDALKKEESAGSCTLNCDVHFHSSGSNTPRDEKINMPIPQPLLGEQNTGSTEPNPSESTFGQKKGMDSRDQDGDTEKRGQAAESGYMRVIQNFTPSWFIITMSTGILSVILHQLPYNGDWLHIISTIIFVLNVVLFLLFTAISLVRYTLYPKIILVVLRHPHQSLFLATFPVGLATIINMTVLVCVPVWGQGMAIFAWVLWWIVSVLAITACFHLTYVIMTNKRSQLEEMTALYFIPVVSVVIAATSGALVAGVLTNRNHQLWTLVICYIFWGIGSPLSWIILTIYFLRMATHKPLKREVIVSLLLPIGPLGLSGFCIITLGKLSLHLFPLTHSLAKVPAAGQIFYAVGFLVGLIMWGFGIVWLVVAVVMIATTGGFPFNMGWWGFIFPVGVFTLLTISIGEEFEARFFKVLSCVLAGICVVMWVIVAIGTIQRSITGEMFYAPCLGTDLYQRKRLTSWKGKKASKKTEEAKEEV